MLSGRDIELSSPSEKSSSLPNCSPSTSSSPSPPLPSSLPDERGLESSCVGKRGGGEERRVGGGKREGEEEVGNGKENERYECNYARL